MKNYFVRPVFNRPEMLQLSIESEIVARERYCPFDLCTIFAVEHGAPQKVLDVIADYPYEKLVIHRQYRHGDPMNQLEAIKLAGEMTSNYIFYSTDDIVLHESYYRYIDQVTKVYDMATISTIVAHNISGDFDNNTVLKRHHFSACAPVITKHFYDRYLAPHINIKYYANKMAYCGALNQRYKKYWGPEKYKFGHDTKWHSWDGLCNRLVDVAMVEEGMFVATPGMNRQMHIGYYGSNRSAGKQGIPGNTYEEKLSNLRKIIQNPKTMFDLSGKQYDDYKILDSRLDNWDGKLHAK